MPSLSRKPSLRLLPALLLLGACAAPGPPAGSDLDALLWMRTAAEHDALCLQAFAVARAALDRALADSTWTACLEQGDVQGKPPAIIVDIDETVLDSTDLAARELLAGEALDAAATQAWFEQSASRPLPGARDFLQAAAARGVTVFYVTNRSEAALEATRRNVELAGFPLRDDLQTVICRTTTSDKGPRRAAIAAQFRVLLLLGDGGGDFTSAMAQRTPAERQAVAAERSAFWGERWIVLPNPAYGDWRRATVGWKEMARWEREIAERKVLEESLRGR